MDDENLNRWRSQDEDVDGFETQSTEKQSSFVFVSAMTVFLKVVRKRMIVYININIKTIQYIQNSHVHTHCHFFSHPVEWCQSNLSNGLSVLYTLQSYYHANRVNSQFDQTPRFSRYRKSTNGIVHYSIYLLSERFMGGEKEIRVLRPSILPFQMLQLIKSFVLK